MRSEAGAGAGAQAGALATVETSWQGNPPINTSTGGTVVQSTVEMSPTFGMLSQWSAKTRMEGALISEHQIVSPPGGVLDGEVQPPEPENSEPTRRERPRWERWPRMRAPQAS